MYKSKPKPTTTNPNPPTTKPNQVWRPKNAPTQAKPQVVKASSSAKELGTPCKKFLRALELQVKLFGHTSILLPQAPIGLNLCKNNKATRSLHLCLIQGINIQPPILIQGQSSALGGEWGL